MRKLTKMIGALGIVALCALTPGNKAFAASGDVAINGDNFPDEIFADYVKQFDLNADGVLSLAEGSAVSEIDLDEAQVRSLKGIEYFTQLAKLSVESKYLTEINLRNNTNLQKLTIMNYSGNQLDLSNNPRLIYLQLDCYANARIDQLDFSKNPNLYQLAVWAKSEDVGLSNIILNNNEALKYLDIISPTIKDLDLSHCPALYELELSCNGMTHLDTGKNPNLDELKLTAMDIKQIDVSSNQKLSGLIMKECYELESLDISKNTELYNLTLSSKRIKSFKTNKYLKILSWTSAESLETLDISDSPALTVLELAGSKVNQLQLNSPYMRELRLGEQGNISSIDLKNCPKLREEYNEGTVEAVSNSFGESCHEYSRCMVLNDRTKVVNNVVIQVLPYDSRAGFTEGGGAFSTGDKVTVRAYEYADLGYHFKEFQKVEPEKFQDYRSGVKVSDKSTYSFKATKDMVLVAVFECEFPNEIKTDPGYKGPYACGRTFEIQVEKLPGEKSLGKMTYQWYRDRQAISGANKATYTAKAEDIGSTISCVVTNKDGLSRKIVFEGRIVRKGYVKAPEGLTTSTTSYKGASDGAILGTTADLEYSSNEYFSPAFRCGKGKTTNLAAGTYYVRTRETDANVAGEAAKVTIQDGPEPFQAFVEIKGKAEYGEELHLYCDGEIYTYPDRAERHIQWKRNGKAISGETRWDYRITKEDIGQTISVTVSDSDKAGSVTAKLASKVEKKSVNERLYGIKITIPSKKGAADGMISGLTDKMEYSTDRTFATKKKCPNGSVKVKAGTYYVRVAETEITKAGWIQTVKVPEGPTATEVFIDIKPGDWYENAVKYVFVKGIMNGVSSENFNPNGVITRAEFVTALHNLAGKPGTTKKTSFKDVKKGAWYEQAVNWAYSVKITSGLSKDQFGTEQKITRQQAAVMLYQYAKVMKLNTELDLKVLDRFPDKKDVATWGKDGLAWAVHNGVVNGKLKGKKTVLAPNANLTRAECAQMIKNMMDNTK